MLTKTGALLKISQTAETAEDLIRSPRDGKVLESKNPEFLYIRGRAISADAPNGNGDYFPKTELKEACQTFIGVNMFVNHQSSDPRNSIGKVIDSYFVESEETGEAYIECLGKIDKKLNPKLARQIETGELDKTSMGCNVETSICSVCGTTLHSDADPKCSHLSSGILKEFTAETNLKKYGVNKGEPIKAYAINVGVTFNEWSVVDVPADSKAKIKTIISNLKNRIKKVGSLQKEERVDVISELEKLINFLDIEDTRKVRKQVCSILDNNCKEEQNMGKEKQSGIDHVLEKLSAKEYKTLMEDIKNESTTKETSQKREKSDLSLSAQFIKKDSLEDSYWLVKEGEEPIIKASLKDIWGDDLQSSSTRAYATSDEYKKALIERIKSEGVNKVAYLLTGNKKELPEGREADEGEVSKYKKEKRKALKNLPNKNPHDKFHKKLPKGKTRKGQKEGKPGSKEFEKAHEKIKNKHEKDESKYVKKFRSKYKDQIDADEAGISPGHKKQKTEYDVGTAIRPARKGKESSQKENKNMKDKTSQREGKSGDPKFKKEHEKAKKKSGPSQDPAKKFRNKYKKQIAPDTVSPAHKKHKTEYDIGLKDVKEKSKPEGKEVEVDNGHEKAHKDKVKKVEKGTKDVEKSKEKMKTIYEAGTHLFTSQAKKAGLKLANFLEERDMDLNIESALKVFTKKLDMGLNQLPQLIENSPETVEKFAKEVQNLEKKSSVSEATMIAELSNDIADLAREIEKTDDEAKRRELGKKLAEKNKELDKAVKIHKDKISSQEKEAGPEGPLGAARAMYLARKILEKEKEYKDKGMSEEEALEKAQEEVSNMPLPDHLKKKQSTQKSSNAPAQALHLIEDYLEQGLSEQEIIEKRKEYATPEETKKIIELAKKRKQSSQIIESSAFDKQETIILGDGIVAKKDEDTEEIVVTDSDGEELGRYPDGFGDDISSIIKLLRDILDLDEEELEEELEEEIEDVVEDESEEVEDLEVPEEDKKEKESSQKEGGEGPAAAAADAAEEAAKAIEKEKQDKEDKEKESSKEDDKSRELESKLEQMKKENQNLRAEVAIKKKNKHCKKIVDSMVDKGLLTRNSEYVSKLTKQGKDPIDARAIALKAAKEKQFKRLMSMDEQSLEAFKESIKDVNITSQKEGSKKTSSKTTVANLSISPTPESTNHNWMDDLPWD